ncbi:sensor histidine kinase [Amycolatopsis pigmentata]|uniref:histidine kinase n=1 Tax=Amycolatopsis pigmentata TaxID=450801 RepID=A0ABW5FPZ9_9PSEU
MSDLQIPDRPGQLWEHSEEPVPTDADSVRPLRSHVLRILVVAVAIAAVLGAVGVVIAAQASGWTPLICVVVALGCVVVALVAVSRAGAAVSDHGMLTQVPSRPRYEPRPDEGHQDFGQSMFGDDPNQRREVFGKLARRLQSLVNRAIQRVDGLEREIEDPELLRGLYEIDHLATRVRRQSENLAVLGGGVAQRRSNTAVSVYAVLRSAVAEIEHYKQVSIVPVEGVSLHGHAVAEIIHLLAELLENATTFTAPDAPKVVLRAQRVTAGLAVEIQDRGLGMTAEDLHRINRLLDGSATIDLGELLSDGRIGMAVVKELARRHNIRVQLQSNIFGGIDAAVVIPHTLLSTQEGQLQPQQAQQQQAQQQLQQQQLPQHQPVQQYQPQTSREMPVPEQAMQAKPLQQPSSQGGYAQSLQQSPSPHERASRTNDQLPPLPSRNPGGSPKPPSPQPAGSGQGQEEPPPLPQRRGTHLRPELREPPQPTRPLPGHNTNLMATVQKGFERGREALDESTPPAHQQYPMTQGDSTQWPTT